MKGNQPTQRKVVSKKAQPIIRSHCSYVLGCLRIFTQNTILIQVIENTSFQREGKNREKGNNDHSQEKLDSYLDLDNNDLCIKETKQCF